MRQPHENGQLTLASYLETCQYGSVWFLAEWRVRLQLPSYGWVEALMVQPPAWEPAPPLPGPPIPPHPPAAEADSEERADPEPPLASGGASEPPGPPQPYYYSTADEERAHAALTLVPHFRADDFANSSFRGFTYNHDERLRPLCSVEDVRGSDAWIIRFVVAHPPERCRCFDREAA
jgi:hypothetical protein